MGDIIREIIDIGLSPNDGSGDELRTANRKANTNFQLIWDNIVVPFQSVQTDLAGLREDVDQIADDGRSALRAAAALAGADVCAGLIDGNPNYLFVDRPNASNQQPFTMLVTALNTGSVRLVAGGLDLVLAKGSSAPYAAGEIIPGKIFTVSYSPGGGSFTVTATNDPLFGRNNFTVTARLPNPTVPSVWSISLQGGKLVDRALYRFAAPATPNDTLQVGLGEGPYPQLLYDDGTVVRPTLKLVAGCDVVLRWDAAAVRFYFHSTSHDAQRITALEVMHSLADSTRAVSSQPWGTIGPSNAVTAVPAYITDCGSSVFTDDNTRFGGAPSGYAPINVLCSRLNADWPLDGLIWTADSQSVGGQVLSQFQAQLNNSARYNSGATRFILVGAGMNDWQEPSYNSGQTLEGGRDSFIALIEAARAKNMKVLACTSPHPQTAIYDYASFFANNPGIGQTYPRIQAAPVNPETGLYPPASKSRGYSGGAVPPRDMSDSGILSEYDLRFWHGNRVLREVALLYPDDVILLDAEWAWFRYGVEVYGVAALYNAGEVVHPNLLGHQVSFWQVFTPFSQDLAAGRLLRRYYRGDEVNTTVDSYKLQVAIMRAGRLQDILNNLGQPPGEPEIRWSTGAPVSPGDPLYLWIKATLGYTDADMTTLFAAARRIF